MIVLWTKPSGLYRHRRGLGLHGVGYKGGDLHILIAKLAFHAKESPSRHGTKSSILCLHSPTVWPKYIVRLSEDPLIQDSLSGRAPHPRGPLVAQPTYFFLLYISTYLENIQGHQENLIPPPQPSISARSHLGAFAGAPPEGEPTMEGFYINTIAPPMSCE